MVGFLQLPGFASGRITTMVAQSMPVWPRLKFRELTGDFPRAMGPPATKGHNSHVWCAVTNSGTTVKLYRFDHGQSAGQMVFLLALLQEQGIRVPQILEFDDADGWVIAEWIDGQTLQPDAARNPDTVIEIAELQASINTTRLSETQYRRKFSYFHDLVLPRYLNWTDKRFGLAVAGVNQTLVENLAYKWPASPHAKHLRLTDPDFSIGNLIRDNDGGLAMIDTEFLTADASAGFEIANFLARTRLVSANFSRDYLSAYGLNAPTAPYLDEKEFWDACVALKQVGKQAMNWRASDADLLRRIDSIGDTICAK